MGARHIPGVAGRDRALIPVPEEDRFVVLDRYDLGQATYAMMLAAADLGIGSGHSSVGDQDRAREILGFPDGYIAAYMIGLGYPADRPLRPIVQPDRRPFAEVVHRGTLVTGARMAFDPFDPVVLADPYPAYAETRETEGLTHLPLLDAWLVSRHEDVVAVLRQARLYSSARGMGDLVAMAFAPRRATRRRRGC